LAQGPFAFLFDLLPLPIVLAEVLGPELAPLDAAHLIHNPLIHHLFELVHWLTFLLVHYELLQVHIPREHLVLQGGLGTTVVQILSGSNMGAGPLGHNLKARAIA